MVIELKEPRSVVINFVPDASGGRVYASVGGLFALGPTLELAWRALVAEADRLAGADLSHNLRTSVDLVRTLALREDPPTVATGQEEVGP